MNIPYLDLSFQQKQVRPQLDEAYKRVLDSNWFILGPEVEKFEVAACKYFGAKYAIGVASGLDALIISLRCAGIGPGAEVLVPAHTYIATWQAISMTGATIVPVPMNSDSFNLSVHQIEKHITAKTKAIMPVHLYGIPCDMTAIMAIAKRYDLKVIEDNSQAQGATHHQQKTGVIGHINGTSLYPGKNLGAIGDAGLILTNNEDYATEAKTLRNYGSSQKYKHDQLGYNSRLDELQAAFLSEKLKYLDEWNQARQKIAAYYMGNITNQNITLPSYSLEDGAVHHIFPIRSKDRARLAAHLRAVGIQTLIHYPIAIHLQKAYQHLGLKRGDFPIAESFADEVLSLPIYPGLSSQQLEYICDVVNGFE